MNRLLFVTGCALLSAGCAGHSLSPVPSVSLEADSEPKSPAIAVSGAVQSSPAGLRLATVASSVDDPYLVKLAPLTVERREVEYDIHLSPATGKADEIRVSWVSPARYKMGFHVGDRLMTLDGKPVADVPLADLRRILQGELKPGESHPVTFTGVRHQGSKQVPVSYAGGIWEPNRPDASVVTPPP